MNVRIPTNNVLSVAARREIKRQILEAQNQYDDLSDALMLWTLHTEFGFGKDRLERFYRAFLTQNKELQKYYMTDSVFPANAKLEALGVNLKQIRKEQIC